jgi:hypothetical protein
MDLHARGWGISVALLFVFWTFIASALVVIATPYEPDSRKAMLDVQWLFTGVFALQGLSVFAVVQYRRRHPSVAGTADDPHADEFLFIRLDWWPYILLSVAALFGGASWLGYPLFD